MERASQSISPATQQVRCNGLDVPVLSWGGPDGGRPILLLHGFPQEPATWGPLAEALAAAGFRALAPFQRGYCSGTRPQDPQAYTFTHFVQDTITTADALDLNTFDVVGFGVGGAVAWMLAALQPMRVRSLTAIRFPHPAAFAEGFQQDPAQKEKWAHLQKELGAGTPAERAVAMLADDAAGLRQFLAKSGLPQPFLDRYITRLKEPGALSGALSWEPAISLEEFSKVRPVTVPSLLFWVEGPAFSRATAEAARRHVHAPFTDVPLERGGHFLLETSPESLIAPLLQHLRAT